MAGLIYSTELTLKEPCLIDRAALEDLSRVVEKCWDDMLAKAKECANQEATQEVDKYSPELEGEARFDRINSLRTRIENRYAIRSKKRFILKLTETKNYESESLHDALKDQAMNEEVVKSMLMRLRTEQTDVEVSIDKSLGPYYRIQVSPERDELSKKIFVELRDWVERNRVPWWQRLWHKYAPYYWFSLIAVILLSSMFVLSPTESSAQSARQEARALLAKGITERELTKAVELLLRIESRYITKEDLVTTPNWYRLLFVLGLPIGVVSLIRPKLVIGIGKGVEILHRWKLWLKFIVYIVPVYLFSIIAMPYFQALFAKYFGI